MAVPTARQLEQRAEEIRVVAGQMHTPLARLALVNLALSYERLAQHAARREADEQNASADQDRKQTG